MTACLGQCSLAEMRFVESMIGRQIWAGFYALQIYRDADGYVFIDRSGKHFGLILNFLREGAAPLPECRNEVQEILIEAKYFLIQVHSFNHQSLFTRVRVVFCLIGIDWSLCFLADEFGKIITGAGQRMPSPGYCVEKASGKNFTKLHRKGNKIMFNITYRYIASMFNFSQSLSCF